MTDKNWPAWYSSPDGSETEIFHSPDDVPAGWTTGAEKAKPKADKDDAQASDPVPAASSNDGEVDAGGWPWSADLHASTKAKTKDGFWRMKVGVPRPVAKTAAPLDL